MRAAGFAFCVLLACGPSMLAQQSQRQDATGPFWLAPKTELNLKALAPASVKLVAGPDGTRQFALLKIGDVEPSANFVPSAPELTPYLPPEDTGYKMVPGGLKVDAPTYGDRKYKIKELDAALAGLTLLQTKAGHKAIVDGRYSIILTAAKPCYVFVAIDQRALDIYRQHGTPSWLEDFAPSGHKITTDDPIMSDAGVGYMVFVKKVAAGRIVLGPPCMETNTNSMYFAFFAEDK